MRARHELPSFAAGVIACFVTLMAVDGFALLRRADRIEDELRELHESDMDNVGTHWEGVK